MIILFLVSIQNVVVTRRVHKLVCKVSKNSYISDKCYYKA